MKKILYSAFLALASMAAASCSDSTIDNMYTLSMTDRPAQFTLSVNTNNISIDCRESSSSFNISGTDKWVVSTTENWISLSDTSGEKDRTISFTVTENASEETRKGEIVVTGSKSGTTQKISVSQTGDSTPYLYFVSDGTQSLSMSKPVATMEYSLNGNAWEPLETKSISFGGNLGKLRIRGKNLNGTDGSIFWFGNENSVECHGDIRTLLDYDTYKTVDCSNAYFNRLFSYCTSLVSAPELPATNLADGCYWGMFSNCTSLVSAPELPATNLASSCYSNMFEGCTSLVNAPKLPAINLVWWCYSNMFEGCTSLVNAPELPATNLASSCYSNMFEGCTSLVNAPELPATNLDYSCYSDMFEGCTSLVNAPELPATNLDFNCYSDMFKGCTSLVNAPELPATNLVDRCYWGMFEGCTSLVNAPELPATNLADGCYGLMFYHCTSLSKLVIHAIVVEIDSNIYNDIDHMLGQVTSSGIIVVSKNADLNSYFYRIKPESWSYVISDTF